jgi:hypothetical protein
MEYKYPVADPAAIVYKDGSNPVYQTSDIVCNSKGFL